MIIQCGKSVVANGSIREGRKMTEFNIKSMIRSFYIECDNAITSLKFSNIESVITRIKKSFDTINKLNKNNELEIRN